MVLKELIKYVCPYIFLVSCGEKGRGPGEEVVTDWRPGKEVVTDWRLGEEVVTACLTCPRLV